MKISEIIPTDPKEELILKHFQLAQNFNPEINPMDCMDDIDDDELEPEDYRDFCKKYQIPLNYPIQ